jgi:regulator of sigma E protease
VDSVIANTPAAEAGLKKGDVITSVNGTPIADYNDFLWKANELAQGLDANSFADDSLKARTVDVVINGTDSATVVLTSDFKFGFVAALPQYKVSTKEYGFFESIPAGISYGCDILSGYVNDLKYVFTKEGAKQVGGFVAIGNIFPAEWDWRIFWMMTAMLSIVLGFMNVLPIPALDGGHIVFTLYEMITGKKPSDKFLYIMQVIGMILIFGLMFLAFGNDIARLIR